MDLPNRKRTRLKHYDYSTPGAYFVTICTCNHQKILGNITDGDMYTAPSMQLSAIGTVAQNAILEIEEHYANIQIDKWVVMPNHIHMIVRITARMNPCPTAYDIPNVVGKFKAAVTREIRKEGLRAPTEKIWQFSYHDHVVRGQADYDAIWTYIDNNPAKWQEDCFYR
ncbi:MAG: transposase [Clostridia bacterium]|nr:transposase [Clostridia bacterium]